MDLFKLAMLAFYGLGGALLLAAAVFGAPELFDWFKQKYKERRRQRGVDYACKMLAQATSVDDFNYEVDTLRIYVQCSRDFDDFDDFDEGVLSVLDRPGLAFGEPGRAL